MAAKKQWFVKILVNCLPLLAGVCLFRLGWASCLFMIPVQIAAVLHNYFRGRNWRETALLGVVLAAASGAGVHFSGRLYLYFVCYDVLGELLFLVETLACVGLALVFALISVLARRRGEKAERGHFS